MIAESLTKSSWTSLKADASNTPARGTIVVYGLVGDTPGICWMQAVKRKNRLAYLENCSIVNPYEQHGRTTNGNLRTHRTGIWARKSLGCTCWRRQNSSSTLNSVRDC